MPTTPKPEAASHPNIYAALAAFQADIPLMKKDSKASVQTKSGGSYGYSYAGLDVLVEKVVPLLGKQGIAWVALPTVEEGRFLLRYGLYHGASDTSIEGIYPLVNGTPQEVGSAITYARRYGLLSMTGTFPADEDDDGAAATSAHRSQRARDSRDNTYGDERPQQGPPPQRQAPLPPQEEQPPQSIPTQAAPDRDASLAIDPSRIDSALTVEELRDVYREFSAAKQLDRILPTGEAVRDAINSRRVWIVANTPEVSPDPTAEGQAALDTMGTAIEPDEGSN